MTDRIRTLSKRIAETLPVQSRRRHELFEELRLLRDELAPTTPPEQVHRLEAALLLMEFMSRSEDVATSETIEIVAGLVATLDEACVHEGAAARPKSSHVPSGTRTLSANPAEHRDLRLTQDFLIGTILLQAEAISQATLTRALQLHASSGQPLGRCLVQLGAVTPHQVESALHYQELQREAGPRSASVPPAAPSRPSGLRLTPKQEDYVQSMNSQVLGEVLIRLGSISREELSHALSVQRAANIHVGEALVETGAATWDQVRKGLEVQRQLRRHAA